jgi:hypothetical protein
MPPASMPDDPPTVVGDAEQVYAVGSQPSPSKGIPSGAIAQKRTFGLSRVMPEPFCGDVDVRQTRMTRPLAD